jgi:hypothetical protein
MQSALWDTFESIIQCLKITRRIRNIGAFCLRMRENRSVRLQMADFKGGL